MSNNKQQPKPENPNNQFSNAEPLTHAQRVAITNKMTNNKQSSVEWYIIERHNIEIQSRLGLISPIEYDAKLIKIEEQAKAMHRVEIMDFAFQVGRGQDYDDEEVRELAKIVYNETFGGNNE